MPRRRSLSLREWRLGLRPYLIFLAALFLMIASAAFSSGLPRLLERLVWIGAPILVTALPLAVSMRFNDLGQSRYWPLLPMVGLLLLFVDIVREFGSVGGAPGGGIGSRDDTLFYLGGACLIIILIMALYALSPRVSRSTQTSEGRS